MSAAASSSVTAVALEPFKWNLFQNCPGGLCSWVQDYSEAFLVVLALEGLLFLATLCPPVFSWSRRKPDGKKRVFFALLACVTFYFWLAFLALNSVYCFGFLAHEGPCKNFNRSSLGVADDFGGGGNVTEESARLGEVAVVQQQTTTSTVPPLDDEASAAAAAAANESCASPLTPHESDLKNITFINGLIVIVLIVVLIANAKEALNAKALHHIETLCKKEDVQKFLSSLVVKPPEVGHHVSCFHPAKSPDAKTNATRKVVTFSAIENFEFQSWRDFSDVRLVDPSPTYPIIEIEVVLNFFPGDHFTAERYKNFVMQLTKKHSSKDAKISIDDYFHIEDHREWTFFIGNPNFLSPWWDKGFPRFFISCFLLFGWPFRLSYDGQIAKHQVEVKKAVFCENSSQDEGVSLSATPGSSSDTPPAAAAAACSNSSGGGGAEDAAAVAAMESYAGAAAAAMVSTSTSPMQLHLEHLHYQRSAPLTSPRTHLRETTKDIVTAVTHQDINGMSTINTIALKDIDVQMTALSGYETYV